MIKLNFKIESFYYDNNELKIEKFEYCENFNEEMLFGEVLDTLHQKFSINSKLGKNRYIEDINQIFWRQFFSKDLCSKLECDNTIYEELTLLELDKQFKLSKLIIPVLINPDGLGAYVGGWEGITFYFNSDEKDLHPGSPHIHCEYSGEVMRIRLDNLAIMKNDIPFKNRAKRKLAIQMVKQNQDGLLLYWNKVVLKGEIIHFKMAF